MNGKLSVLPATVVVAAGLSSFTISGSAHHSAAPFYDETKTVEIHGIVTKWSFVNPHPFLYVDAVDEQGEMHEWIIEFAGPVRLQKIGWSPGTFTPGETITATGHPPKAEGTYGMFSPVIVRENGTVVEMAEAPGGAGTARR